MTRFVLTPIAVSIHPEGENPVFSERATHICIDDDAGGAFLVIKQSVENLDPGIVRLDPDELEVVLAAAQSLIGAYPKEIEE